MPKRRKHPPQLSPPMPLESFHADVVTVGWLVSCLFTIGLDFALLTMGTGFALGYRSDRMVILGRLILAASVVVAPLTLALTYFARKLRMIAPPPGMVLLAVLSSLFPLGLLLAILVGSAFR